MINLLDGCIRFIHPSFIVDKVFILWYNKDIKELIYINNIVPINKETGEIIKDGYVIFTTEQLAEQKKRSEKQKYSRKNLNAFFWLLHNVGTPVLDDKISGATLTRFIYLSTYIKYSSDRLINDNGRYIKKSQLPNLLKITEKATNYFLKECKNKKLLFVNEDKTISVSKEYIAKEPISNIIKEKDFIRVYIKSVRDVYKNSSISSHKTLSYLFKLIPYVNRDWNVVCQNPYEKDYKNINDLSLGELANIWGYHKSHLSRLKSDLWNCKTKDGKLSINFIAAPELFDWRIIVNPNLFYAGNQPDEVNKIAKFIFF